MSFISFLRSVPRAWAIAQISVFTAFAGADSLVPRPPQYVALAFDGSQTLSFWRDSRAFSQELRAQGIQQAFTYFISGVYFLEGARKGLYQGPHHLPGHSDIGFGSDRADLLERIAQTNAAYLEGHEIGSHANGHFDGSRWSKDDWELEFALFNQLIFGAWGNNELPAGGRWEFTEKQIQGFRAPLLGVSPGLWPTLAENGFRYDTSRTAKPDYWPEKIAGVWNFPLAEVTIAGTGKHTLSMDYNFYLSQSGARNQAASAALYEQQMLDTYRHYFNTNYNGNRAPIHIGHHFAQWNGGAYWRAMKTFAREVCGLPEVKCVTYQELVAGLEAMGPDRIMALRRGAFAKSPKPLRLETRIDPGMNVSLKIHPTGLAHAHARLAGSDAAALAASGMKLHWEVDGVRLAEPLTVAGASAPLDLGQLPARSTPGASRLSAVATFGDVEIARATHALIYDPRGGSFQLGENDLELEALGGDLPQAHEGTHAGAH